MAYQNESLIRASRVALIWNTNAGNAATLFKWKSTAAISIGKTDNCTAYRNNTGNINGNIIMISLVVILSLFSGINVSVKY